MTKLFHISTVPFSLVPIKHQLRYMQEQGFDVHAVSSSGSPLDEVGDDADIETHAVHMKRNIAPVDDLLSLYRLFCLLRQARPDIVHAHTPKAGLLGMIAAFFAGVPIRIYHIRGLRFVTATGGKRFLLKLCEQISCRLAHRVISVSHSIRDEAIENGLVSTKKIRVMGDGGHGIDAQQRFNPDKITPYDRAQVRQQYGIPTDACVIGFVGRIVRDKGMVELSRAWRILRANNPQLHLLIVGFFEDEDPIPQEIRDNLESDNRVHFTGEDWNTPPLYAAMDIFCLPTYREGLPNVPLEAGAMRVPTVATRVTGCVDAVLDGFTGLLVPVCDSLALADALQTYIDDPRLRLMHGAAARTRVLNAFRPQLIWETMYDEYVELLQQRGLPTPEIPKILTPVFSNTLARAA